MKIKATISALPPVSHIHMHNFNLSYMPIPKENEKEETLPPKNDFCPLRYDFGQNLYLNYSFCDKEGLSIIFLRDRPLKPF